MNNIRVRRYPQVLRFCRKHYSTSFVTTPIFYVNAAPHIGHLYSAVIADAYHRFEALRNPDKTAIFSTGTDEHGIKVQQAAGSKDPISIKKYCDTISTKYKELFDSSGVNYTHYIRTTDSDHKTAVQTFWKELQSKGFIYKDHYSGWYCVPDEMFLTENQLVTKVENGREIKLSEVSGHPVEWNEEENYMFKLSKVKSDVLYWLKDETKVTPSKFHKQLLVWLNEDHGSFDISISRPVSRIPWGIPVPDDDSQTVYVWLDALVNYLTVAGYPNCRTWPPTVQVVGKDILKFHGIYWPAFLIAAGLEPPRKLFVHSHWMVNDEKMSKSKNNVVNPFEKISQFTASGFRYFLLKEGVPHSDGNYSEPQVINMLNADLANTLGNLLNRCTSKSVNLQQVYPSFDQDQFGEVLGNHPYRLKCLSDSVYKLQKAISQPYQELHFYKGIYEVLNVLYLANAFFEQCKPWEMKKIPEQAANLSMVLHITMEVLRICGIALLPIVPEISHQLFRKLNISPSRTGWKNMKPSWLDITVKCEDIPLTNESIVLYRKIVNK
ncbi:methionine--tRNA ligase, mitochondrial-like [Planococcus citri]|uniref:methionine--tRNA ligase, mitochondrial-like n=1 Tax=Planococcus citri TaxID=170843 RepID=UPI0031F7E3A4